MKRERERKSKRTKEKERKREKREKKNWRNRLRVSKRTHPSLFKSMAMIEKPIPSPS